MVPDLLVVGHLCLDVTPEGPRPGGSAAFAALAARALGLRPAVVTSAGPDLDPRAVLGDVPAHVLPARRTTSFLNRYRGGRRSQTLLARATPLGFDDVPPTWRRAPLVLLAPVAGEVPVAMARSFPQATVVACLQGWLRRWDPEGRVFPRRWEGARLLPHVEAATVSQEDFRDADLPALWAARTPLLVVTMGEGGAHLHEGGRVHHVPALPAREVDPTGAGDVFAAAFLVRYAETRDPLEAARFAAAAASLAVEAPGLEGIAGRREVEERLALGREGHQR